jgi:hypothetical protein
MQAQVYVTAGDYLQTSCLNLAVQDKLPVFPMWNVDVYDISSNCSGNSQRNSWLGRKLFSENFLEVDSASYSLIVDPAVHVSAGKQTGYAPSLYENTRGIRLSGNIHRTLFFSSELYETQSVLPSYLDAFADSFEVAPGVMRSKEFKEYGRDYASVYGSLVWVPSSNFQLWFARDKLHFGHGYRSVLLSHHAPASTFVRASISRPKWSYHYIFASMQNVSLQNILAVPQSSMGGYQNKYAGFLIVSLKPSKLLEVSLFESIMWAPYNDKFNSLHTKHFNPLPFTRTAWYGLNNENNIMTGVQMALTLPHRFRLYGQYALDDAGSMKKTAVQAGMEYFYPFYWFNVRAGIEYNSSGAYFGTHSNALQSFSHYHHTLTHPLGGNYREFLGTVSITGERIVCFGVLSFVQGAPDSQYVTNGQSVYSNPSAVSWEGGWWPKLTDKGASMMFADMRIHYLLNGKSKLNVFVQGVYRKTVNTSLPAKSIEFHAGVSTNLRYFTKNISWL